VFDFPNVLSKFLLLGMPLEQVIACGSTNAARVFPAFADRGTLRVGSPADITVLDLQDGSFEFVDNENTVRIGRQKLVASEVVLGGKRVDR
jgi:dihydroorotase